MGRDPPRIKMKTGVTMETQPKAALVFLLLLLNSASLSADVYRCQDSHGRVVYTDRRDVCPGQNPMPVTATASRVERRFVSQIPDLLQTHPLADFLLGGRNYCAPAAVANSLAWLNGTPGFDHQVQLAGTLADPRYMNSAADGTTPNALLRGVSRYFRDQRQRYRQLGFQGWRSVPQRFHRSNTINLNWLADGIGERSTVWLNIGWYRQHQLGQFQRIGGHWVTLVGYELSAKTYGAKRLIVHDPAPRSGHEFASEYVDISPMVRSFMVNEHGQQLRPLTGLWQMKQGLHLSKHADIALLDGAVRLDL